MSRRFATLAALALAVLAPGLAMAQVVTVTAPNTATPSGAVLRVDKTFIVNPDGTLATITPSPVSRGGSSLATGQVSVGTSSTLLVAARSTRQKVVIAVGAANTCAFGNTGVTASTGFPLQPVAGATITLDTAAAIYGACSAATTVSFIEQY